jgi:nitrogen fixation/metabolism regulation signal transduction histidine kinase
MPRSAARNLVESQRAYLETVLARLSSGVVIIDQGRPSANLQYGCQPDYLV